MKPAIAVGILGILLLGFVGHELYSQACAGAGPVYRLLGKKDLGATEMPAPDIALISGDIGFRLHEGGHSDAPDWPAFLNFARKYFKTAVVQE